MKNTAYDTAAVSSPSNNGTRSKAGGKALTCPQACKILPRQRHIVRKCVCLFLCLAVTLLFSGCEDGASASVTDISSSQPSDDDVSSTSAEPDQPDYYSYYAEIAKSYPCDEAVPQEWIAVYSISEALENADEIINYDYSDCDTADIILSLVNKNVLFFTAFYADAGIFEIDWDSPVAIGASELNIYPAQSSVFPTVESIYEFTFSTYNTSIAEDWLLCRSYNGSGMFFSFENQLYVYPDNFSNWSGNPFVSGSYIEITDVSDELCAFIWHFPDLEGLNEPEDGLLYFYYEKQYTASYSHGMWVLDDIILNNWD